jgi:hypothetical protein
MQSNRSIKPPDSAAPGVIPGPVDVHDDAVDDGQAQKPMSGETPERADPRGTRNRARGPFAKLLGVVRGDKYMADAYEPAWSAMMASRAGTGVLRQDDDGELDAAVQRAAEPRPIGAGAVAPAAPAQKER